MNPTSETKNLHAAATVPPDVSELVSKGLIAQLSEPITGNWGDQWSPELNDFLDQTCPPTVHPSLWQQANLNRIHGLFELTPGLYQARGYDVSNISFIAGETGWIVVDPLTNPFTAKACLDLLNQTVGERPVVALIYTHSHSDHYGGASGLTSAEEVEAGKVQIIAPADLFEESVRESLLVGPAMLRRGTYQFGSQLSRGGEGYVDMGVGLTVGLGPMGMVKPSVPITERSQEMVVDGVRIIFLLTPETEATSEMMFYLPDLGALCTAELCTGTVHNLVPIRGAAVRDSLAWSKYINESLQRFGSDLNLTFPSHNWPVFGNEEVREYLRLQRDVYRWMHDQTLRMANKGHTAHEIAEALTFPEEFLAQGHTRGYYGSITHNIRAIFQKYFSWYDGNPSHLNPLPPVDVADRYVEYMGGAEAVLERAERAFDAGDYRWVVEVVNHVIFADPRNSRAREIQIAAFEQLGYQSESATYRNAYLTGAHELLVGAESLVTLNEGHKVNDHQMRALLSPEHIIDFMAVRLRGESLDGIHLRINWKVANLNETWLLEISNRALHGVCVEASDVDATLSATTLDVMQVISETLTLDQALAGPFKVTGSELAVRTLFDALERYVSGFAIVEP
jgi:alkyl sulfatase BDS1-like metallo-beta-lactamase superfamily hydrolase